MGPTMNNEVYQNFFCSITVEKNSSERHEKKSLLKSSTQSFTYDEGFKLARTHSISQQPVSRKLRFTRFFSPSKQQRQRHSPSSKQHHVIWNKFLSFSCSVEDEWVNHVRDISSSLRNHKQFQECYDAEEAERWAEFFFRLTKRVLRWVGWNDENFSHLFVPHIFLTLEGKEKLVCQPTTSTSSADIVGGA